MPGVAKGEPISYDINIPYKDLSEDTVSKIKHPEHNRSWDPVWFDLLPPFDFEDPALRVQDKSLPELHEAGFKLSRITPRLGSVVSRIQLNKPSSAAKDELAYLITQRKVLAFEN